MVSALSEEEEAAAVGLVMLANGGPGRIDDGEGSDPWKIRKVLSKTDVNGCQGRLLVTAEMVKEHIMPHLDEAGKKKVHSEDGLSVRVRDEDEERSFGLNFKHWRSSSSYVLVKGWRGVVKRRRLKKGDEIGLCWSPGDEMLFFSVLRRA